MPFSPRSPGASDSGKSYLLSCPFEEKDDAKKLGAKWDFSVGSWYVPAGEALEPFNKWHPNGRKYIVCGYEEKDDAKKAGARWDASCKQWYFDATSSKLESKLAKWLPSSKKKSVSKAKTKKKSTEKSKTAPVKSSKPKALTKSQIAAIPRINTDMTIAQLQAECRARDPSITGISTKNKSWFLEHLKIGTPWISSEVLKQVGKAKAEKPPAPKKSTASSKKPPPISKAPTKKQTLQKEPVVAKASASKGSSVIHEDMTISQLQMECRARDPDIKGLTNKNKSWFLHHLKIGTTCAPRIHADMTIPQLQLECRSRDPEIKGLSSKNKTWFLDHLKVGTTWISWSKWIHADMTIAQLQLECRTRDPTMKGLTNKNKTWLLDHLKIGTLYVSFSQWKDGNSTATLQPPKTTTTVVKKVKANATATKSKSTIKRESSEDSKPKAKKAKTEASLKKQEPKPTKRTIQRVPDVPHSSHASSSIGDSQYKKISSRMGVKTLIIEAEARNLSDVPVFDSAILPEIKNTLLDMLVEGSICVHESPEYKAYEKLLKRVEREDSALREAYSQRLRNESLSARTNEIRRMAEDNKRKLERIRQEKVYVKKEADSSDSSSESTTRQSRFASVNEYRRQQQILNEYKMETEDEESDSEDEYDRRFNTKKLFAEKIRNVKGKHLVANSSEMKYTVWCSDGYDADGWHSYDGPPKKEFDSVWATKNEANARAKYLFFWKSPWGLEAEEIDSEEWEESITNGLKGWTVSPPDSSRWTVGIVPSAAYPYLENCTTKRHNHDSPEREPVNNYGHTGYYGYYETAF